MFSFSSLSFDVFQAHRDIKQIAVNICIRILILHFRVAIRRILFSKELMISLISPEAVPASTLILIIPLSLAS
jgi:hypothetical protein